jgi:small subunit ribosomal protein S3
LVIALGIIRGWDSNWYADKDYGLKVVEDEKIRNYLRARRPKTATADPRDRNKPMQNGISRIVIERTLRALPSLSKPAALGLSSVKVVRKLT